MATRRASSVPRTWQQDWKWPQPHIGCGEVVGHFEEGWAVPHLTRGMGSRSLMGRVGEGWLWGALGSRQTSSWLTFCPDSISLAWFPPQSPRTRTEDPQECGEEVASHTGSALLTPNTSGVLL